MKNKSTLPGRLRKSGLAAIMGCLSLAALAATQSIQAGETIDLPRAIRQTLAKNPELSAYPFQLNRAEALKLQAGLRPVPTVGLEVENVFGTGAFSDTDAAETTLSLSQVIELGDKRNKRINLADARIREQELEYELARLDVLAETGRRYYHTLRLQALRSWAEQRVVLEQQALAVVEQRAVAGAVGQADASKISLRQARSVALREQLDGELTLARRRLAAMWLGQVDFSQALGDLQRVPGLPDPSTVIQALQQAPKSALHLALQRLADSRVAMAQANGSNDVELGMGVRRFELVGDEAFTFSISMPLSFSNPNRGRIAAARAQRQQTLAQVQSERQLLELSLLEIQQKLQNLHRQIERISDDLLPRAQMLLRDTEAGYRQGRYSVLQWVDAQAELFSIERELIETRVGIFMHTLELERITGHAMSSGITGAAS
jgi:cobalt-zinc-cadmium efflux system outer membrane protein